MSIMVFSDKFFQRGHCWEECIASWTFERESFLRKIAARPHLPTTAKRLGALPRGVRMAVYYSDTGLDSLLAMPAIGETLSGQAHLEVRFFSREIFAPLLSGFLGRSAPLLLGVNSAGVWRPIWGPRAELLQQALDAMNPQAARDQEQWLSQFDTEKFSEFTDRSIAARL